MIDLASSRARRSAAVLTLATICLTATGLLANDDTTIVLHAWPGYPPWFPCEIDVCGAAGPPTVQVSLDENLLVIVYVRNFDQIGGVETAFDFGTWTFVFGLWDCQSAQVNGTTPQNPGGPIAGTIATAFDCVTGGGTTPIGRMHFSPVTTPGCLTQVESGYPYGTCVVDCQSDATPVPPEHRGSICAGMQGGVDVCEPAPTPVTARSWGTIKRQYHR